MIRLRYEVTAGGHTKTAKSLDDARAMVIPFYIGYLKCHDTQIVGAEIKSEHHQRIGTLLFKKNKDDIEITWKDRCSECFVNKDGTLCG